MRWEKKKSTNGHAVRKMVFPFRTTAETIVSRLASNDTHRCIPKIERGKPAGERHVLVGNNK